MAPTGRVEDDVLQEDLAPGLMVVHGNQAETLRDLVLAWIRRHPLRPLETEHILVQSNGVAQWLKLSLAADPTPEGGGCGIAAALEFHLPAAFLWRAYRAVLGHEQVPEVSPFDKPRLAWRLMRLLPTLLTGSAGGDVYAPLRRFLSQDQDRRKSWQLADRLADLFDQYQVYRADWLAAWADHQDVLIDARGQVSPLEDGQRWQAALWRALLADVAQNAATGSGLQQPGRAAVHQAFLTQVRAWTDPGRPPGLPRRLVVFGISSLPGQSLEVLAALARWTQVLVCVHNPCQHHWADTVSDQELLRSTYRRQARRQGMPERLSDELLHQHAHPLLAAWGKQGRDFIGLLDQHDSPEALEQCRIRFQALGQRTELFAPAGGATLLQQLQDDILDLRPLHETRALWPAVDPVMDRSVRFHSAHSPQREVEVLHDQLLAAFNADPTLAPREVLVMVPDVQTYAPHVQAVFGLLSRDDPRFIPFSIVDQAQRAVDPLLHALQRLLQLPRSRLGVSELLDLLEVPAIARRFQIGTDDLPLLHRWIRGARIRWGLHAAQRAGLGLPAGPEDAVANSWLFGLRRLLLGYAVGQGNGPWNGIEPHDEVGGLDAALLGPLARLLDLLESAWLTLAEPASPAIWVERLEHLLQDFFLAEEERDQYTLMRLSDRLREWQQHCLEAQLDEPLPLSVVGEHWLAGMDEAGLGQRFFGGAVTFATLMPMRAIPFRLVCLLGMNDGDFPRSRVAMDFDLMGRQYRPGDRSRRSDDHYMFLEALLSARERLYLSWVGRSVTDNTPRPPSVLMGLLRDHMAAGWRLAGDTRPDDQAGAALLQALTTEHRLQPFSPDYFNAGAGGKGSTDPDRLFTYAAEWRPTRGHAQADVVPLATPEPPLPPMTLDDALPLQSLVDFLRDPVKAFLRRRLGVALEQDDPASEDQEPFQLDALQKWAVQRDLALAQLAALATGGDLDQQLQSDLAALGRRGELAPGAFGRAQADALAAPIQDWLARYQTFDETWPERLERGLELDWSGHIQDQALCIQDRIDGLRRNAQGQFARLVLEPSDVVVNGRYRGDKLLAHWVAHLACHMAGQPLSTCVIGKIGHVVLEPLDPAEASARWTELLQAWLQGMCRPLPLAARAGFEWLRLQGAPAGDAPEDSSAADEGTAVSGLDKVRLAYEGTDRSQGDLTHNPYLQRVYPRFDDLSASGEFFELAHTLLRPLQRAMPSGGRRSRGAATTEVAA